MRAAAAALDEHLTVAAFTTDPVKAAADEDPLGGKRRRDEDFKRAVAVDGVLAKRAPTAAALLRATATAPPSSAPTWTAKSLLTYQASCVLCGPDCSTVSVCVDGGRLGNPAENCELFAFDVKMPNGTRHFMWPPPQACGG